MEKITYKVCPLCHSNDINAAFSVQDFTVSQEQFIIFNCNSCTARFTQGIPSQAQIGDYYKSNNYISHSDTKEGLVSKLYHSVRNITLKSHIMTDLELSILNEFNKRNIPIQIA